MRLKKSLEDIGRTSLLDSSSRDGFSGRGRRWSKDVGGDDGDGDPHEEFSASVLVVGVISLTCTDWYSSCGSLFVIVKPRSYLCAQQTRTACFVVLCCPVI